MRGILKNTALLMGSLLCIFTLTVGQARSHELPDRVPLMAQDDPKYGAEVQRLVQIWPGISQPLILTDYETFVRIVGVDAAGTSLYYEFISDRQDYRNYCRVSPKNIKPQLLADTSDGIYGISPNLTWVLYDARDALGAWDFRVKNVQTGQEWSISELMQPRRLSSIARHRFSTDETWLYIAAFDPNQFNTEIVALHLADGTAVELSSGLIQVDEQGVKGAIDEWVIFSMDNTLYRIRNDGTGLSLLFDEAEIVGYIERAEAPDYVVMTYPEHDLVIVRHRNLIFGVNSETGHILWQVESYGEGFDEYQPSGWVVPNTSVCCSRFNVFTGVTQNMPDSDSTLPLIYLASDATGRWMAYAEMNPVTQHRDSWLYDWDTGQSRLIRRTMDSFGQYAWSPDGEWLLMEDEITHNWYRLRLDDGHMELLLTDGIYRPVAWMRPLTRTWQPIPLMLIASALLVIGLIPRRLFGFLRRPVLMSRTLTL